MIESGSKLRFGFKFVHSTWMALFSNEWLTLRAKINQFIKNNIRSHTFYVNKLIYKMNRNIMLNTS